MINIDPYEEPEEPESPTEAPEVSETDEPIRNPIFNEGSGDDDGISTDRSTVFTAAGCRGDATFTCQKSGYRICDEQRCDEREDCPDGEDEKDCGFISGGFDDQEGNVGGGDENVAGKGEDDGGYEHGIVFSVTSHQRIQSDSKLNVFQKPTLIYPAIYIYSCIYKNKPTPS